MADVATSGAGEQGRTELAATLLTRGWRDANDGLKLTLWASSTRGPLRILIDDQRPVCFVPRDALPAGRHGAAERQPVGLRSLDGAAVDALYFRRQRDLLDARHRIRALGVRPLEADLKPVDRYLMERFVTAGASVHGVLRQRDGYLEMRNPVLRRAEHRADLRSLSLDIETCGLDGELYSVGLHDALGTRVYIVGPDRDDWPADVTVVACADETQAMERAFADIRRSDPDVLIGWNVVSFDLDYLNTRAAKLGIAFDLGRGAEGGRGGERATVLRPESAQSIHVARVPGRVVLDGIDVLKAAFYSFENFELDTVARALLGEGKVKVAPEPDATLSRVDAINSMYRERPAELVTYNARDCSLVTEIFAHARLLEFAMRRAELTGLTIDRLGGSVAAFDFLYLPRLHRRGFVACDVMDVPGEGISPGGYVLDSAPGLFDHVLLLDFKSLYPSIIRTFKVDPLAMAVAQLAAEEAKEQGELPPVPGFEGAYFDRDQALLPAMIESLWDVRDAAKRDADAPLSQAVKILMNSFYGVLGANGCRFRDHRLTSSITRRGHEIIRDSRDWIEARGHQVIYGDTDSLFVLASAGATEAEARGQGATLALELNAWWAARLHEQFALASHLEIEFETLFLRFLMPTVRGETTGSKKRYAGLVRHADKHGDDALEVVFKGLEAARSDWTPLARSFQRTLFRRAFLGEPVEAIKAFVRDTDAALLAGELDEQCVYAKRLRRETREYTRNVPPHVQAARLLDYPVRDIRYVITSDGPRPVRPGQPLPRPDYVHYRERQLAPAANTILAPMGLRYETLTDAQIALF